MAWTKITRVEYARRGGRYASDLTDREWALLEAVTDPDVIFDLRQKLDAAGLYDEFEVERVVKAELDPSARQSDLVAAIDPVARRIVGQFAEAKKVWAQAKRDAETKAEEEAKARMDALDLVKADMQTFLRVYAFLSQIFDYGSTAVEKRAIFYRRLVPLLEFGREREGIDLSQVQLTHHRLASKGRRELSPGGDGEKLKPLTETGAGAVQDKEKVRLAEIIAKVNDLFEGDITEGDKLTYVNEVLKGKLLQPDELRRQAANNSKEQFASSPDLSDAILDAVIEAFDAHQKMSGQALDSQSVREGIRDALLGPGRLWERLKEDA